MEILPLNTAVLTISDTRTVENDKSGQMLSALIFEAGHTVNHYSIVKDDLYQIRAEVSRLIADPGVQVIITTGGTGVTGRDVTPEAVKPLLDTALEGFGELFRVISYQEIGAAAMQSRALGGVANGTYIFCLPGSTGACRTAWNGILSAQLSSTTRPCNLADLMPRLKEKNEQLPFSACSPKD